MRMQIYRVLAAVLMMVAMGVPQGVTAPKTYGALAYSPSRGADGFSYNYRTPSAARSKALQQCAARARGCKIVANFSRGCAALAIGRNAAWGVATSRNRRTARANAVRACRKHGSGCRIQRSICS